MRGPSDGEVLGNTDLSRISRKKNRDRFQNFWRDSSGTHLPNNYTNAAHGFRIKIFSLKMAGKRRHTDYNERFGFFHVFLNCPQELQEQSIF